MGEGLVVLDEMGVGNKLVEGGLVKALEEVAPVIAVDVGLEEQESGVIFPSDLHERLD